MRQIIASTRGLHSQARLVGSLAGLALAAILSGCALFGVVQRQVEIGDLYQQGRYPDMVPLAIEMVELVGREYGTDSQMMELALDTLAGAYYVTGDFDKARPLIERVIILRRRRDPSSPDLAQSLNNLAGVYNALGEYAKVAPALERSLEIYEEVRGPDHPDVALSLKNLAGFYIEVGECDRAIRLAERALAIFEEELGEDDLMVAEALQPIAICHTEQGDPETGRAMLERGLAIRVQELGPEHPEVAESLINLAEIDRRTGNYQKALHLLARSQAICETQGVDHPCVAISLSNRADVHTEAGEYSAAVPLYERSLSMSERLLGPDHPMVAGVKTKLARVHWARGDYELAYVYLSSATEIEERNIALFLHSTSEGQARAFMETLSESSNAALSLPSVEPRTESATRLAMLTALRRKGRVLDTIARSHDMLRRELDPEDRSTFDDLLVRREALARLVLRGPANSPPSEHRRALDSLRLEVDELERLIRRRGGRLQVAAQPVHLEDVQAAIPSRTALIELVAYENFEPAPGPIESKARPTRFAALLLKSEGPPSWTPLGDARHLDALVDAFRGTLQTPNLPRAQQREAARRLYQAVVAPLLPALEGVDTLLLAPDGSLNLIPFGALIDENERYLVERYAIAYLTTGRDLLRMNLADRPPGPALVLGAPDYDASVPGIRSKPAEGKTRPASLAAGSLGDLRFGPLPGTLREAEMIEAILEVEALTGALASERTVKQASRPRVLHIATHGFFLADQDSSTSTSSRGLRPISTAGPTLLVSKPAEGPNPLLRSGLAFAGANNRGANSRGASTSQEDGILTALEMSGLDLSGTKLVVLSACETGLGELRSGDGVYGLRRAIVIAGAESQLASLWKVDDAATQQLMAEYYQRLARGMGRAEALRQTQLRMLHSRDLRHPYYWASFIPIGAWRPFELVPSQ